MNPRPFSLAVAIAAAFSYAAPPASADMMTIQFTGGGIEQSISLNGSQSDVGGGPFNWTVTSAPASTGLVAGTGIQTWCIDVFHSINTSSPSNYTLAGVNTLPNSSAIRALFGEGFAVGGVVADPAAFQLALWELEFDNAPGDLSSGNFQYTGSDATKLSNANALVSQALFDAAHGVDAFGANLGGFSLFVLDSGTNQDQIVLIPPPPNKGGTVPAPPAALLAAFGLFALGGRSAWFRRTAAKQS